MFAPELLAAAPEALGVAESAGVSDAILSHAGLDEAFGGALKDPGVRQALAQHFTGSPSGGGYGGAYGSGYPVDQSYAGLWWFLNAILFAAVIVLGYYIGTKLEWFPPIHFP